VSARAILRAAEGASEAEILAAIEALEDRLAALTGKPRAILGTAAFAARLGVAKSTVDKAVGGVSRNALEPRIVLLTKAGVVYGLSESDVARWAPAPVGQPKKL
jgi:hypothetical protein